MTVWLIMKYKNAATVFVIIGSLFFYANAVALNAYADNFSLVSDEKIIRIIGKTHGQFVPAVLDIKVGESVKFLNSNGVEKSAHSIVSIGEDQIPDGKFDTGLLKVGESYTVILDEPGTYYYIDSMYPDINGVIIVT